MSDDTTKHYHLGIAEGFKRAAIVCEREILDEKDEPMPTDERGLILRQVCEGAMRMMAVRLRRLADEAIAKAALSESEGTDG